MRLPTLPFARHPRRWRGVPAFLRDDSGSAATEFSLVAMPFLLFVLGLLGMGLYFLANHSLQYGAEAAARKIRTGEAEKGKMTVGQFRNLVCDEVGRVIDCGDLNVLLDHAQTWSGIAPPSCLDGKGNMTAPTGAVGEQVTKYSGSASEVVLVTLCYKWDLANYFSFLKLGSGANGTGPAMLQAAAAFKSEPYNP